MSSRNKQHRDDAMTCAPRSRLRLRARRRWALPLLLLVATSCLAGETVTFAELEGAVIEIKLLRQQRISREGREFSHQFQSDRKIEIGPGDRVLSWFTPTAYTPKGTRTGKTSYGFFMLEQPRNVTTSGSGYGVWLFADSKLTFLRTFHGGGLKMVVTFARGPGGLTCSADETFAREEGVPGIVLESAIDGVPATVLSAKQISGNCRFAKLPISGQ